MEIDEQLKNLGIFDFFYAIGNIYFIGKSRRIGFINGKVVYEKEIKIQELNGNNIQFNLRGDLASRKNEDIKVGANVKITMNLKSFYIEDIVPYIIN